MTGRALHHRLDEIAEPVGPHELRIEALALAVVPE
jgi:hypothetical protein